MRKIPKEIKFLDEHGKKICSILNEAGKQCYIVGGAVRDALLGKEPADIDFATDAKPEEMKQIFESCGCAVYPTGEKFGTLTVSCDGVWYYEITTFRGEHYRRLSRHPEVHFSNSIQEDLSRRDFTINAMAYDPLKHEILDPYGGYEDLENKIIRAVGDPDERFSEDPLRMLRMCRFKSVLNGSIDKETYSTAAKLKDNLQWIPKERIRDELMKALKKSEKPSEFIECIVDTRLNDYVIPELYDLKGVEQGAHHKYDAYEHTLRAVDESITEDVRLAALLHDIAKPETKTEENGKIRFFGHAELSAEKAKKIMRRLKFSNSKIDDIVALIRYHMFLYSNPSSEKAIMRFLRALTGEGQHPERVDELEELMIADALATGTKSKSEINKIKEFFKKAKNLMREKPISRKELAVNGRDIVEKFGVGGSVVGDTLEYLLNKVWEGKVENKKSALLKLAEKYLKSRGELKKPKKSEKLFLGKI